MSVFTKAYSEYLNINESIVYTAEEKENIKWMGNVLSSLASVKKTQIYEVLSLFPSRSQVEGVDLDPVVILSRVGLTIGFTMATNVPVTDESIVVLHLDALDPFVEDSTMGLEILTSNSNLR